MPPETFREAIGASVDTGEDTAPATPAAPAATETTTPAETTPEPDTAEPATGEPEWRFDQAEFDQQHPELAPYRKQLQGSYTKAQQEIAEQRKTLEGVDPAAVNWVKQVQQLAQTNPGLAAQMLEQERQRLAGLAPPPAPDPFQDTTWLSDGERVLAQRLQAQDKVIEELRQAHGMAQLNDRFSALEKEIGKSISYEDREKTAAFCMANGIRDPSLGWKAMNFQSGVQMGRDQAAAVVAQKQEMGPAPNGVSSREGAPADRVPKTAREAIEMAYDEAERRSA